MWVKLLTFSFKKYIVLYLSLLYSTKDPQSFCKSKKKLSSEFFNLFFLLISELLTQKKSSVSGFNSRHIYAFSTEHAQKFHHSFGLANLKEIT